MLRRLLPVLAAVSLVCCLVALPASAASYQVLNYKDYVLSSSTDYLGQTWEYFQIPKDLCGVLTIDKNGTVEHEPGKFVGTLVADSYVGSHMAVASYWPGTFINKTYIDASNIPDGSLASVDFQFTLSDVGFQTEISIRSDINVQYFDSNFNFIGYQTAEVYDWNINDSQVNGAMDSTLRLNKPADTAYLGFYACFDLNVLRSNDEEVTVEWWIGSPRFEVSNVDNGPSLELPDSDGMVLTDDVVSWLRDVVDAFLDFEIAPGFSFNKIIYFVLVVGVLFWFIKVIS